MKVAFSIAGKALSCALLLSAHGTAARSLRAFYDEPDDTAPLPSSEPLPTLSPMPYSGMPTVPPVAADKPPMVGNEGDEGDEGNEGNEGDEGDEGNEGNEGDEGDEGNEGNEGSYGSYGEPDMPGYGTPDAELDIYTPETPSEDPALSPKSLLDPSTYTPGPDTGSQAPLSLADLLNNPPADMPYPSMGDADNGSGGYGEPDTPSYGTPDAEPDIYTPETPSEGPTEAPLSLQDPSTYGPAYPESEPTEPMMAAQPEPDIYTPETPSEEPAESPTDMPYPSMGDGYTSSGGYGEPNPESEQPEPAPLEDLFGMGGTPDAEPDIYTPETPSEGPTEAPLSLQDPSTMPYEPTSPYDLGGSANAPADAPSYVPDLPMDTTPPSSGGYGGTEGNEGNEGDEGDEGNEGDEGDEGNEGNEGDEGDEGNEGNEGASYGGYGSYGDDSPYDDAPPPYDDAPPPYDDAPPMMPLPVPELPVAPPHVPESSYPPDDTAAEDKLGKNPKESLDFFGFLGQ